MKTIEQICIAIRQGLTIDVRLETQNKLVDSNYHQACLAGPTTFREWEETIARGRPVMALAVLGMAGEPATATAAGAAGGGSHPSSSAR